MQAIIQFLIRYSGFFAFLILELVCIYLVVNYNSKQRAIFMNSSKIYQGKISEQIMNYDHYFKLIEENDSLSRQNAKMIANIINTTPGAPLADTLNNRYIVKKARIVSNGYKRRNNHFVLDVGHRDSIAQGMGVIDAEGLLGIITSVNKKYALANSILHSQTRISCTVKPHLYPGSLIWKNDDFQHMTLTSIPKHVKLNVGDTIVTNGFSTIFPRDITVGFIESFKIDEGRGAYDITVRLANDVAGASIGYVIIDKDVEALRKLDSLANE